MLALAAMVLTGCKTVPPKVILQEVKVPVPVECKEPVPERPMMPTEELIPPVQISVFAKSAMAEIERREGYEKQLRVALSNCKKPVSK